MKTIEIEDNEVYAMRKMLDFIKFSDRDDEEILEILGSKFISSFYNKINVEYTKLMFEEGYTKKDEFEEDRDLLFYPRRYAAVVNNIKLFEGWNDYDKDRKIRIIKSLTLPFNATDELLNQILIDVDNSDEK